MFWFVSKKQLAKEKKRIRDSFKKRDKKKKLQTKEIEVLKDMIKELGSKVISKQEVELLIEEKLLKVHGVREPSTRTSRTPMRKKVEKMLTKAEIIQEIKNLIDKDYSTTEARYRIVSVLKLCKRTCFYKYLKLVREKSPQVRELR